MAPQDQPSTINFSRPDSSAKGKHQQQTILVSGASGTVGKQIVLQLLQAGHAVRALTRHPEQADFPAGVQIIQGDLTKPETLAPALDGVTGLHLITFSGSDYSPLQTGAAIVELARKAGVQRLTVLWNGEGKKGTVEKAVEASDLAWTILQPQEFMANVLEWAPAIRSEGTVRIPFVHRPTAGIHEADIAAVAVAALTAEGHAGRTYRLTGPEVLTPAEQLKEIGDAIGRNIRLIELSEAEARASWQENGLKDEVIDYLFEWYRNTPAEGYTVVPTVEQVSGRPARSFQQWVATHKEAFL